MLIDAAQLHTHYGASHILHGASLSIGAGEAVGLLGRNGMGKTTLIRTLLGLVRPTSGAVRIRGTDCTRAPRSHRAARNRLRSRRARNLPESIGAGEPSDGGATRHQRPSRLVHRSCNADFSRAWPSGCIGGAQLSGGEQQMLAIGRALMTNPDVMLLDEATEGLAPLVVREIWRIIGAIRATGIASLIVDRNYRSVLAHTDRCVVLEKGAWCSKVSRPSWREPRRNWRDILAYRKRLPCAFERRRASSQTTQAARSSATPPMMALARP